MGLSGFYPLLKTHGGYVPSEVQLEELRGKTVALDGDYVLYVALHGQTKGETVSATDLATPISEWLGLAKQAEIQTIFVTTGGPPPAEKQRHCGVLRKRKQEKQQQRIRELQERLPLDDLGEDFWLRDEISRLQNTNRTISGEMSREVVALLRAEGWNCRQATSEADFLLVLLSEEKKCDYVATDDADILVSGAEHVLRGFLQLLRGMTAVGKVFCRSEVLRCLQLTSEAFLQLGVLLGCDYQPAITNVGPVTAFRMIQKYGSVEQIIYSGALEGQTRTKKRKYSLPEGMSPETYCTSSSRSVEIFCSRPDKKAREEIPSTAPSQSVEIFCSSRPEKKAPEEIASNSPSPSVEIVCSCPDEKAREEIAITSPG